MTPPPSAPSPPAPAPALDLSDTVDQLLGEIESAGAAIERAASDSPTPRPEVLAQAVAPTAPASKSPAVDNPPTPPTPPESTEPSTPAPTSTVAEPLAPEQTIEQVDKLLHDAAARLDQEVPPSPESIKTLDEHISQLTDQMLGSPAPARPSADPSTSPQTAAPVPAPATPPTPTASVVSPPAPAKSAASGEATGATPASHPAPHKAEVPASPPASTPAPGEAPKPAPEPAPPSPPREPLGIKLRRWLAPANALALRGCAAACQPLESHGIHAHRALGIIAIATAACATMTWGIVLFRPAPQGQASVEAFDFEHGTPPPIVHHAEETPVSAGHKGGEGEPAAGEHGAKAPPKKDAKKSPAKGTKKDSKKDPKKAAKKPPSGGGEHGGH